MLHCNFVGEASCCREADLKLTKRGDPSASTFTACTPTGCSRSCNLLLIQNLLDPITIHLIHIMEFPGNERGPLFSILIYGLSDVDTSYSASDWVMKGMFLGIGEIAGC